MIGSLLSEVQDDLTLKEILLTSERVRRKLLKENEDLGMDIETCVVLEIMLLFFLDKHLQSEIQMKKKLAIEVDKMTSKTELTVAVWWSSYVIFSLRDCLCSNVIVFIEEIITRYKDTFYSIVLLILHVDNNDRPCCLYKNTICSEIFYN